MRHKKNVERRRAIYRGLEFIYQTACDPKHFEIYGHDYLGCFLGIASTSRDARLAGMARRMGRERARYWRRENAKVTPDIDADEVVCLVFGSHAADQLGVPDLAFKETVRAVAQRFAPQDYFWFDPAHEPPAADVPEVCKCGEYNKRGRKTCYQCKRRLYLLSPYAVLVDALTRSYIGERYGIKLGASLREVLKWLPTMRPYPTHDDDESDFFWALYAVTHVIYTLNDYSFFRLSPRYLPDEYDFLTLNLRHFIDVQDPESTGELLDTLKSFGLSETHPLIVEGVDFLLAQQNSDGSWGDTSAKDIYERYHTTWTAIDGLREYAWPGGLRRRSKSFPFQT